MAPGCFLKVGCPDNPVENRHSAEIHPLHKLRYRCIGLDIVYINMGIEIEIDLDTEPEYLGLKPRADITDGCAAGRSLCKA